MSLSQEVEEVIRLYEEASDTLGYDKELLSFSLIAYILEYLDYLRKEEKKGKQEKDR